MTSSDDKKKQSFLSKLSKKTKKGIQKLGETNIKIANHIEQKFIKMFDIELETMDGFITSNIPSNIPSHKTTTLTNNHRGRS